MLQRTLMGVIVLAACAWAGQAAEPLAEKYLLEGKLADGETALKAQLTKQADDDQQTAEGHVGHGRSLPRTQ